MWLFSRFVINVTWDAFVWVRHNLQNYQKNQHTSLWLNGNVNLLMKCVWAWEHKKKIVLTTHTDFEYVNQRRLFNKKASQYCHVLALFILLKNRMYIIGNNALVLSRLAYTNWMVCFSLRKYIRAFWLETMERILFVTHAK
jgi:hypothetical protein